MDVSYIAGSTTGYTLSPGIYKISDNKLMLKSVLPNKVEVNSAIEDIRLISNKTIIKTNRFTKKTFYRTKLRFTQSHSVVLGGIEGFINLIPGTYKNVILTILLESIKFSWNQSIVNEVREPNFYSLVLSSPPSHKIYKESRVKLFEEINKPVLSHITLYLEHGDYKIADLNGETTSFPCQLIKK